MKVSDAAHLREQDVPPNTCEVLPVDKSWRGRIRKQAYENAVTLMFLAICFGITWFLLLLHSWGIL